MTDTQTDGRRHYSEREHQFAKNRLDKFVPTMKPSSIYEPSSAVIYVYDLDIHAGSTAFVQYLFAFAFAVVDVDSASADLFTCKSI